MINEQYYHKQPKNIRYGGFVLTFIIMDLVFCCLRIPLVVLSIIGYNVIEKTDPLYATSIFEIMAGVGIIIFGVLANILIIAKKKIGCTLTWGNVLATILSMIVALWQLSIMFGQSDVEEGSEKPGLLLDLFLVDRV